LKEGGYKEERREGKSDHHAERQTGLAAFNRETGSQNCYKNEHTYLQILV